MGTKLTVKCSEGELAVWKDAAHEARLSLSEWVRRTLTANAEATVLGEDRTEVRQHG